MKKVFILSVMLHLSFLWAMDVTVSILPQVYFVKQIAGNLAKVNVMVKPGSEPADYEPKPKQLRSLSRSKVYFAIGVPFEKSWLKKFKDINPNLLVIDTSKGIKKREMQSFYAFEEKDKAITIKTSSLDPHIWLSPKLVKIIAKNITKTFIKIDPKHKKIYTKNLATFLKKLSKLQKDAHKKLDKLKNREFIVFHPVWGYFAGEFGLRQIPLQIEGKSPKPKTLIKLIKYAKKRGIKVVFVQPQFSKKSAEVLAKNIGAKVVVLDPLSPKWFSGMKKAIDTFSETLR